LTLTIGTGPIGHQSAGEFNITPEGPAHVLYFEDSPKRVRAVFGGQTVADSRRCKLLHETGLLPVYYIPADDFRDEAYSFEARDFPEATRSFQAWAWGAEAASDWKVQITGITTRATRGWDYQHLHTKFGGHP
jgi:uncharacterized protein (DUF427 family)